MIKEKVLPADTFVAINRTILNDQDRKLLVMLYQPVIGYRAISLYFTLWNYFDRKDFLSCECTHHQLMTSMQLKLSDIVESREKLEAMGLIKSYMKKGNINNFVYELYSPLGAYDFLNNPVLATALYNNIGKTEYDKIVEYYKIPRISLREYDDITCSFNDIFETTNMSNFELMDESVKKYSSGKLDINSKVDIDNIVGLIPEELFNVRSLTKDTIELIHKIAFIYNYDDSKISELIRNSLTDKKSIDKPSLKINSRKYYQFENSGKLPSLVYRNQPEYLRKPVGDTSKKAKIIYQFETTTPYDFLTSKYNNSKPSKSDITVLEYLMLDMNLNAGVVNVLIDYVLRINNNKLTKNFVDVIASQWAKSKIETVEAAMTLAEKEYKSKKSYAKKIIKKDINPEWFDKEIKEEEADAKDIEELDQYLSKYR